MGRLFAAIVGMCLIAGGASAETELERGRYLVEHVAACGNCHTPMGPKGPIAGMTLAGGLRIKEPPFDVYTPNITQDKETGIGAWSDAEIFRAIREGVDNEGKLVRPPMPFHFYRQLADRDVHAMVAYLRTVASVKNVPPKSVYHIPLPPSYGPPVGKITAPDPSDTVAYGEYLAGPVAHCMECHTPLTAKGMPDFENRFGKGGFALHGPWGESVSADITGSALQNYTDAQIATMVTEGKRPDGSPMMPPMGYGFYAGMKKSDLDAIIAYLRTLK